MESIGTRIRTHRRKLGLTLDELAGRTGISKPYLSLIETGRVPNPPSDDKLRRLEQSLGFGAGQLVTQAHLQRTPRDVRAILQKLMNESEKTSDPIDSESKSPTPGTSINLDDAYMTGVLQELVERAAGNVERIATNVVPVINRVSAGYPKDFTDLSYPAGVADEYVSCPDVRDESAFAARVHGDSMMPKYQEGDIVIFSPNASPRSGDDCFIRFEDGQTTFKRVFFENEDGEANTPVLRLQPRNERYRPQIVKSETVTGLYKAVFKYQKIEGE